VQLESLVDGGEAGVLEVERVGPGVQRHGRLVDAGHHHLVVDLHLHVVDGDVTGGARFPRPEHDGGLHARELVLPPATVAARRARTHVARARRQQPGRRA
jgi:hypothetical protein